MYYEAPALCHATVRAGNGASGPDFGRIQIAKAVLWPAEEPLLMVSRLESGRNPARGPEALLHNIK